MLWWIDIEWHQRVSENAGWYSIDQQWLLSILTKAIKANRRESHKNIVFATFHDYIEPRQSNLSQSTSTDPGPFTSHWGSVMTPSSLLGTGAFTYSLLRTWQRCIWSILAKIALQLCQQHIWLTTVKSFATVQIGQESSYASILPPLPIFAQRRRTPQIPPFRYTSTHTVTVARVLTQAPYLFWKKWYLFPGT